jgi:hypothetical protein
MYLHASACICHASDIGCVDDFDSVVCCSTRTIGELDERFQFKSNKSRLVKEDAQSPGRANGIDDSQFEGALLQMRVYCSFEAAQSYYYGVLTVKRHACHCIRHHAHCCALHFGGRPVFSCLGWQSRLARCLV